MSEAGKGFSSAAALPLPRMLGRRILLKLAARGGMGDVYLAATTGHRGRRAAVHRQDGAPRPHPRRLVPRALPRRGARAVAAAAPGRRAGARGGDRRRTASRTRSSSTSRAARSATCASAPSRSGVAHRAGPTRSPSRSRWRRRSRTCTSAPGADGSPLGIVHRDLSPQNVMVGYAGEVKLIDFGTARGHNRRCHTVAGVVFAKPGYVAPEVARQQVGDGRIDLYALGIMLWELCAGRRFLTGDPQRHLDDAAAGKLVHVPPSRPSCGAPPRARRGHRQADAERPRRALRARVARRAPSSRKLLSSAPAGRGRRARRPRAHRAADAHALAARAGAVARRVRAPAARGARDAASAGAGADTPAAGPVSEAHGARAWRPTIRRMLAGHALPPRTQARRGRERRRVRGGARGARAQARAQGPGAGARGVAGGARALPPRGARRREALAPEPRAALRLRQVARRAGRSSRWSCCAGETLDARLQRRPA